MASHAVRERLAQDLGLWLSDGLVSQETHDLLRERYDAEGFGIAKAIKYLGIAGGLVTFFGLLGLLASLSQSVGVAAVLLLGAGTALTWVGILLALDKLGRYPASSKTLLTLGVVMATLGIGAGLYATGVRDHGLIVMTGAVTVVAIGALAYRFHNTFLLILGLICLFHWVGSWTKMWGQSSYAISVQDPNLMSLVALLAVLVGICHERYLRNQWGRFFLAYETLGLIYMNLSLLILTIWTERGAGLWIAIWTGAAIAQILAGARLHNPLLTGFGVTAFAINIYTRYYENFWNRLHTGVFFLLGGISLLIAGLLLEVVLRRSQGRIE
ncbi:MAG TPA: hypothetical protein VFK06_23400 [Candidatus Angelobacter sp.]|nr:hypothetical protein [Candidatus Angelobacter sp.]